MKTKDYIEAVQGKDAKVFLSLGYQWEDKPHRLVYDLCREVDRLKKVNKQLRIKLKQPSEPPTTNR